MKNTKAKILVVDDEPEIVDTLKDYLSGKGYKVIGALSGEEALDILEKEKTDLILMDIMMPGIKGTEVSRIIKQKYPSVKVIILTGYPKETEELLRENILEGMFTKPIRLQELYNKLSELIGTAKTESLALKTKQGIKARVLFIKAKILFVESSADIYNFLKNHFNGLSNRGENYALDIATTEDSISGKITSLKPDLLLVNAAFIKQTPKILSKILEQDISPGEIVVYNISDAKKIGHAEVERLVRATEVYCFKHGLIEVKWVEV